MGKQLKSAAVLLWCVVLLAACGSENDRESAPKAAAAEQVDHGAHQAAQPAATPTPAVAPKPLRKDEWRKTLVMPEAYTPSAPNGVGTDDYRCFLLDPELAQDAYLTGTNIIPGNPKVVHHVIMFRVHGEAAKVAAFHDNTSKGPGWTCFGNMGFGQGVDALTDAPWLGAWAPGGTERVAEPGFGTRLAKGTKVVMQVHYNLLAGAEPDISAMQMRFAPVSKKVTPIHTMLYPSPVELGCRKGRAQDPLCDRDASLKDVKARFGETAGNTADLLHLLCGGEKKSTNVSECTRTIDKPMTVRGVAGHMHLLGREIKVEVNPGTPRARTILDIPIWNFDDQGTRDIDPVKLEPNDTVKVTCRHVQSLRDRLPSFETQRADRYVLWGEGTTDEMCLGILSVTWQ